MTKNEITSTVKILKYIALTLIPCHIISQSLISMYKKLPCTELAKAAGNYMYKNPCLHHLDWLFKWVVFLILKKDDFQSRLCILQTLFTNFVLFHDERHHKMWTFWNYLHEVLSKFHVNCHYGYKGLHNFEAVKIDENIEKITWKASKIRYVVHNE